MYHLLGATTVTGEASRQLALKLNGVGSVWAYSRGLSPVNTANHYVDFSDPPSFRSSFEESSPSVWVSFAPIWLFAPFLNQLVTSYPDRLFGLRGVIACSSSSAITMRFAFNRFDRELLARLSCAEDQLLATCGRLQVPCLPHPAAHAYLRPSGAIRRPQSQHATSAAPAAAMFAPPC